MAGETDEMAQRTADGLAIVCTNVEEIRSDLRNGAAGDDAVLEGVLAAVRANAQVDEPLEALHTALQADGDAQGLYGYASNGTAVRSLRPAGISGDLPGGGGTYGGEVTYLCPSNLCARYWWPQGPTPVPHCAISGTALRRDRL